MSEHITAYSLAQVWDAFAEHVVRGHPSGDCDPLWCSTGRALFFDALKVNHAVLQEHIDYVREALAIQSATTAGTHSEEER